MTSQNGKGGLTANVSGGSAAFSGNSNCLNDFCHYQSGGNGTYTTPAIQGDSSKSSTQNNSSGAGGGGINASNVSYGGNYQYPQKSDLNGNLYLIDGSSSSGNGRDGLETFTSGGYKSAGGNGGSSALGKNAFRGGHGALGSGGGGGGASENGYASGAGGNGGDGICIVWSW